MLDLHHVDADSAYHNWLERNGVLHSPEIERAFTAGFNILSAFIAGPEQEEVDWHIVGEAFSDACGDAEGHMPSNKMLASHFKSAGLLVVHRKMEEVAKPVMMCGCGAVMENPAKYAEHCAAFPSHFVTT